MIAADVTHEVDRILAAGNGDPEGSHVSQDRLLARVVRHIAADPEGAQALCSAALPLPTPPTWSGGTRDPPPARLAAAPVPRGAGQARPTVEDTMSESTQDRPLLEDDDIEGEDIWGGQIPFGDLSDFAWNIARIAAGNIALGLLDRAESYQRDAGVIGQTGLQGEAVAYETIAAELRRVAEEVGK